MNANSVAQEIQPDFTLASRRLAIFLHNTKILRVELDLARREFFAHLEANWKSYQAATKSKRELEYIAYADGLNYLSRLHSVLYELKSFLDIFSRLICKLTSRKAGPNGFNKGKVGKTDLSGGKLINWINGHTVEDLENRDRLVQTLITASVEWITDAVALRDTLVHYRDIPGFRHMSISVTNGPKNVKSRDICPPRMCDSQGIEEFTLQLRERLGHLISDVLRLTPGVNSELNETWEVASRRLGA